MPRIRTIKPEFWSDEKLAPLDPLTRLVFLGLISMADDAGRLLDNVKSIDGFIFPETNDTSREPLDCLARLSRITRYISASGQRVIQICNWKKHQRVDKPSTYVLPAEYSGESRESLEESPCPDLGPRTMDHGNGKGPYPSSSVVPTAEEAWSGVLDQLAVWHRKEFRAEDHAALPAGTKRGLSKVGGFSVIANTPEEKRVWLKKEFIAAYNTRV